MGESISVVMPAYNEAGSIEQTVSEVTDVLESAELEYEIIVSEDGSTDGTKKILESLDKDGKITALMGDSRKGYTGALKKGIESVSGDYTLFIDGDGQYRPEEFLNLWEKRGQAPVIVGRREDRADSFDRRFISNAFQFLVEKTLDHPELDDMTCSFRLMGSSVAKQVIPEIKYMRDSSWTEFGLRAHKRGISQIEVNVTHRERLGKGDTRIYHVSNLPKVAYRQFKGLWKLKRELKEG